MMEGRPIKFRMLEIFNEKSPSWNYDVVRQIQSEYEDMNSDYFRDFINYDIVELATSGFLVQADSLIDLEGSFRKGSLLVKYAITQIGRDRLAELGEHSVKRRA